MTELAEAATELRPRLVEAARRRLERGGFSAIDAEDVAQDVLLRSMAVANRPPRSWWPWMLAILNHVVVDMQRERERERRRIAEEFGVLVTLESAERTEIAADLSGRCFKFKRQPRAKAAAH